MRPRRLQRDELWQALREAPETKSIVYLTILPEEVATSDGREREAIARRLETKLLTVPSLELYGRVGMYDFLGIDSLAVDALLEWFGESTDARCGVASAGNDGLSSAEKLMLGTTEASRQNRSHFLYRLSGDWVQSAPGAEHRLM